MKYHRHVNVYTFIFYLVFLLKTTHASGAIAIQDQVAFIPCQAFTSAKKVPGTVTLIRWLRDTFHKPLYTLDLRSLNSSMLLDASFIHNGRHFPSPETEGRLYLDLSLDPIVLRIDPVSTEDAGQYTCLIDFRNRRSMRSTLDLQVIEPPKEAIIQDSVGRKLEGVIGPYHIGQTVQLSCEGLGGFPTPKAIWRTTTEAIKRIDISGSLLTIFSLEREDQWSHYTCTVQNTNMTAPKSVTVIIELILPPLELQLQTNIPQPFIAGQDIQITCQSFGSYPKAHIHWRKNRYVLVGEERIANNGNITTSVIEFIAQPSDDANEIECAAVNPDIDSHILRRIFFMRVYYKPEVNIAILSNQTQLSEGNNFILLCNVKSNPEASEIVWFFDNKIIVDSESIIIRHMKLYIKQLKRAHTGTFACLANNDYGEERAQVYIDVLYRPVCLGTEISHIHGQDRSAMNVTCNLASNPSDVTFYWTLRNSSSNHSWSTGYVPHTHIESQTSNFELLCWGRNEIAAQISPCRFLKEEEVKEGSLFLPVIIITTIVVIICFVATLFVLKRRHFNYDLGSTTSSNNEIPNTNGQTCGRLITTCVMQSPTSSENDCSKNLLEPLKKDSEPSTSSASPAD